MLTSSGLKCEPGFGDLFRLAGDTSVSARQYHSRGVTGTRAKLQRSELISGMQGWRARSEICRRVNKTAPRLWRDENSGMNLNRSPRLERSRAKWMPGRVKETCGSDSIETDWNPAADAFKTVSKSIDHQLIRRDRRGPNFVSSAFEVLQRHQRQLPCSSCIPLRSEATNECVV